MFLPQHLFHVILKLPLIITVCVTGGWNFMISLLNLYSGMLSYLCEFFCYYLSATTHASPPEDPCVPSPCGPYSQCRVINNTPACSCLTNYIGQPPNCRPECVIHADCPSNLACTTERCVDPCPGSCGQQANCYVINHNPVCTCPPGYTGNALVACQLEPSKILIILLYIGRENVPTHVNQGAKLRSDYSRSIVLISRCHDMAQ